MNLRRERMIRLLLEGNYCRGKDKVVVVVFAFEFEYYVEKVEYVHVVVSGIELVAVVVASCRARVLRKTDVVVSWNFFS